MHATLGEHVWTRPSSGAEERLAALWARPELERYAHDEQSDDKHADDDDQKLTCKERGEQDTGDESGHEGDQGAAQEFDYRQLGR